MIPALRILALTAFGVAASLALAPTPAAAQAKLIDEVKVGVLAHDQRARWFRSGRWQPAILLLRPRLRGRYIRTAPAPIPPPAA